MSGMPIIGVRSSLFVQESSQYLPFDIVNRIVEMKSARNWKNQIDFWGKRDCEANVKRTKQCNFNIVLSLFTY